MKSQLHRFQLWWTQLSSREQRLLTVVLLSGLMISVIFGMVKPMHDSQVLAQQKRVNESQLLEWVKSKANQIESLRRSSGAAGVSRQPLNQVIATSSQEFNISLIRIQPRGEELQVWIAPLAFDRLLDWMNYLSSQQGISVTALDIERGEQNGVVEVRRLQFK